MEFVIKLAWCKIPSSVLLCGLLERTGRNFKPIPEPGTVLKLGLSLSDESLSEISVLSIHKAATPD